MASFAGLNILVVPCVSPWGYEHVQRWTCAALDPNRGFFEGTLVEEAAALAAALEASWRAAQIEATWRGGNGAAQVEAARPGVGEGEVEGDRSPGPAA